MRRVRVAEPTLAAELENVLEFFHWVRDQVYKRLGVRQEQISLLRRALAGSGKLSQASFRTQTHLRADTVSRAASFICHNDRQWTRSQRDPEDRRVHRVIATPKGVAFLRRLDNEVEQEFFSHLGAKPDGARARRIAAVVAQLNEELPDYVERQRQHGLFGDGPAGAG